MIDINTPGDLKSARLIMGVDLDKYNGEVLEPPGCKGGPKKVVVRHRVNYSGEPGSVKEVKVRHFLCHTCKRLSVPRTTDGVDKECNLEDTLYVSQQDYYRAEKSK